MSKVCMYVYSKLRYVHDVIQGLFESIVQLPIDLEFSFSNTGRLAQAKDTKHLFQLSLAQ